MQARGDKGFYYWETLNVFSMCWRDVADDEGAVVGPSGLLVMVARAGTIRLGNTLVDLGRRDWLHPKARRVTRQGAATGTYRPELSGPGAPASDPACPAQACLWGHRSVVV